MLALYGHPFSTYTWKALIALYANDTPFVFREVSPDHPENVAVVQGAGPLGKFPVLEDGDHRIFEATTIIEYLARHYPGPHQLVPNDPGAAITMRQMDRVFDNYVMNTMQPVVDEHLRNPAAPDQARIAEAKARVRRTYDWLERWLEATPREGDAVTLIECAAAPSLFYADWVEHIDGRWPHLAAWRAHLLALPAVKRCVDDARPYRSYFPPGAPDRD